jgi:hypothetical protein
MGNTTDTNGAKLFIAPAAQTTPADASAYAALTWTEVGLVETFGEYGDQSAAVNFTALGDARVRKGKGARDAGDLTITCGHDANDVGQQALVAAEGTPFRYPFKIQYPNKLNPTGTDEMHYFVGKVMSKRNGGAAVNDTVRRTFVVAIDSAITEVAPTAGS